MVKVQFTVRVEREIAEKLEQRARELGITKTKLVEKILADYVSVKLKEDPLQPIEALWSEIEKLKKEIEAIKNQLANHKPTSSGIDTFMRGRR